MEGMILFFVLLQPSLHQAIYPTPQESDHYPDKKQIFENFYC